MDENNLPPAQTRKLVDVPRRLHGLYRLAVGGSRRAACRLHCLECCGWQSREVELCSAPGCCLWPYRLPVGSSAGLSKAEDGAADPDFATLRTLEPSDDPDPAPQPDLSLVRAEPTRAGLPA